MKILALDPGETTGWFFGEIDNKKRLQTIMAGESRDKTMLELKSYFKEADVVVYENFLIDPKVAQAGRFNRSTMPTIQVIGAIESLAAQFGKKVVNQSRTIKPVGYVFAKLEYRRGKQGVHIQDASAHAFYFAVKQKYALPRGAWPED